MVRGVAKSGYRAGLPLWRCSDFGCRTFIDIDESDVVEPVPVAANLRKRASNKSEVHTESG